MHRKFLTLIAVVGFVAIVLVVQGIRHSSKSVITPKDLASKPTNITITRLKVGGRVAEEGYDYQVEPAIVLRFTIVSPGENHRPVPVIYHQLKPDMFSAGRDVMVEGDFVNGTFEASTLLTQCPSKYEPPKPE